MLLISQKNQIGYRREYTRTGNTMAAVQGGPSRVPKVEGMQAYAIRRYQLPFDDTWVRTQKL